jgi:DNA-binding CsgD family transcriptional regulator
MTSQPAPPDALELIDRIYAALYGAASWNCMLDRARALLPNGQAVLLFHDKIGGKGAVSVAAGIDPGMVERYNAVYAQINPWMHHAALRPLGKVMQADEMLPRVDLLRTQYYDEFLRPQDITTGLGVTLRRQGNINFFFSIICADAKPEEIEAARGVMAAAVPHLNRAFEVEQARGRSGAVAPDKKGIIMLGPDLRVRSADDLALRLIEEVDDLAIGPLRLLRCKDPALRDCIEAIATLRHLPGAAPRVHCLHLKRRDGALPLRVCVYRPGGTGLAFFGGTGCIIHLEDLTGTIPLAVASFCRMHHLSAAESGIVLGLASGRSVEEIASARHTSPATVRTQIKNIFAKTDLSRQAQIIQHISIIAGGGR